MRFRPELFLTAGVLSASLGSLALAQSSAPASARTLIRAGHLLDVHTGKLLDAETIVVSGDRIAAIAPTASTPAGAGDTVIDLSSLTVLPGLIDVHTHITSNPDFDNPGGGGSGRSTASAYILKSGSPDLGNSVSSTAAPNRGAY